MFHITHCKDRLVELIRFVARHNTDGAHHIGFFGEGEADVRASLAECLIPPAEGFLLAYEGDKLAGVFGVDVDHEISRAWLYGPLIAHRDWHIVADELYAQVLALIPADIRDYDLFCDEQNIRMQEFAARHGFPLRSENAVLNLDREKYTPVAAGKAKIIPYQASFFEQFEQLHRSVFPNAYFTARQIVEKIDDTRQLFIACEDERLIGYHFCKIDPETESGYIDFIGVEGSARGRGTGADLLASGLDWMLSAPMMRKIDLTVNADNAAALRLYEKFGFVTERVMRGYRKHITPERQPV
jgi:RimJ/RimL family protein N-acetyltransferase